MDLESLVNVLLFMLGIAIVIAIFVIHWRFYVKAGRPGWASLIPIYNIFLLVKIAGRPGWWTILYFIPLVNIVISIITSLDIAKAFNRGAVFGIFGLFLFSIIGYALIVFRKDIYAQPTHT